MAYLPNIPQSTDQLSISQGNILNNFAILGAIAGNSSPSSSSINNTSGFNWLYLPPQGSIPPSGAAFTAGNIGLYSANSPVTSINELFINKTNQSTVVQVAATGSILSTVSAPTLNSNGWSYLPSGILIKWGNSSASGNATINFPTGAGTPAFTQVFSVIAIPCRTVGTGDPNYEIALNSFTNTSMVVYGGTRTIASAPQTVPFQYFAVGM